MKKLLLLGLAAILFVACQQQEQRYTQQSPEIDTVKKLIKNYNDKTYDTSIYADSSKTFYNTKDKGMSPTETIAYHQANDANYSERGFLDKDQEYEMVKTDDGQTWVNCWLDWKCTLATNGKEIMIPIHLTYQFIDGKVVREVGMWDPTEVVLSLMQMDAMTADEKVIAETLAKGAKAWSTNDADLWKSITVPELVRYDNGVKTVNNQAEYIEVIKSNHAAMPDLKIAIDNLTISGNTAYVNWTATGTNTGEFMGNPATGKKVKFSGMAVWQLNSDGMAVREDVYSDPNAAAMQLGYTLAPPK